MRVLFQRLSDRAGVCTVARPVSTSPSPVVPKHTEPRGSHRRRRGWIALVAVLVVASASIAAGALLASRGNTPNTPTPPTPAATLTGVPVAQQLTWAPPPLVAPTTIKVTSSNRQLRLDPTRDYRIVLPSTPVTLKGGLVVQGGRNVELIGGEIAVPTAQAEPKPRQRRGLYLKDQTGTVHIEGLKLSGELAEGIDLDQSKGATVQLENIEVGLVTGSYDGNHADLLQGWAGPNILRVDGFKGATTYQGFFLLPNQHYSGPPPTSFDLRRIVIDSTRDAAYLLWTDNASSWLRPSDIQLVAPGRDDLTRMLRKVADWESAVTLNGDDPTSVLPSGTPGIGYRTPGYGPQSSASIESSP